MNWIGSVAWYRELEDKEEFLVEEAKLDFACAIERIMAVNQLSRKQVAQRLGTSQAYVTKILKGDTNLTIESMVRVAAAAGSKVHLHVALAKSGVRWFEIVHGDRTDGPEKRRVVAAWAQQASGHKDGFIVAAA